VVSRNNVDVEKLKDNDDREENEIEQQERGAVEPVEFEARDGRDNDEDKEGNEEHSDGCEDGAGIADVRLQRLNGCAVDKAR